MNENENSFDQQNGFTKDTDNSFSSDVTSFAQQEATTETSNEDAFANLNGFIDGEASLQETVADATPVFEQQGTMPDGTQIFEQTNDVTQGTTNGFDNSFNQQNVNNNAFNQPTSYNDNMNNNYSYNGSVTPQTNNGTDLGLIALILSIVSVVMMCCCGQLFALPGLILGLIARNKNEDDSKALAAIIISAISLAIGILIMIGRVGASITGS